MERIMFVNPRVFRFSQFVSAALLALSLHPLSATAQEWFIKDLGTLGGDYSVATDINNMGQVLGYSLLPPRPSPILDGGLGSFDNAFLTDPNGGHMNGLGELGELGSRGLGVNDQGQAVGISPLFGDIPGGFVTGPNGQPMSELRGFLTPTDINNHGQVAGRDDNNGFAFITAPNSTALIHIDTDDGIGAFESATAINDDGLVTLDSGFVWTQTGGRQSIAPGVSSAVDVNNLGQVIGLANGTAFITAPGVGELTLLDTLGGSFSLATGLNNLGQVVGHSMTVDGTLNAFVTLGDALINLETLPDIMDAGWSNLTVAAINDAGQIAGTGLINGKQRAFFLAPVPEPTTYAMLLSGLALLIYARRRKLPT
jgi:probable HAF family extracellular repeat protein